MKNLHTAFVLLVFIFIVLSVFLQFVTWKWEEDFKIYTDEIADELFKRDQRKLSDRPTWLTRHHQVLTFRTTSSTTTFMSTKSSSKRQISAPDVILNKTGILETLKNKRYVWEADSEKNRILETSKNKSYVWKAVSKKNRILKTSKHNNSVSNSSSVKDKIWKFSKNRISVWDTHSDKDRILEQIKFIPVSLKKTQTNNKRVRIILVSTYPILWGKKRGFDTFNEDRCLVKNCFLVGKDHKGKVDAVLFGQNIHTTDIYTSNIHKDTIKIFFALESPLATSSYFNIKKYINWTATYRRDSTIVTPYERFFIFHNDSSIVKLKNKTTKNYASGKTKMAAIFVSNCKNANRRMEIVNELRKYITVDVYGRCGEFTCPRTNMEECFNLLKRNYKFYLAFENANCREYITEKFFVNGLRNDVIPIVMGAHPDDYRKVAPPHSYIHVDDFTSIEALAIYMKRLDRDDNLYNSYFQWKGTGSFINTKFWCRLCAMLNDDNKPTLVVNDLENWWRPSNVCVRDRWLY